jgi:hypothetical protein
MAGYTSGVYWGLMRALKDDTVGTVHSQLPRRCCLPRGEQHA